MRLFENRDCLEAMKQWPDKHFDLAIVDPPYGIGGHEGNNHWVRRKFSKKDKSWDKSTPDKDYFDELMRVSENQIIWGGNYFTPFLTSSMGWVCWFKTVECVGRAFSEFELAYTSFSRAARVCELKPFQKAGIRVHPTQKPIELYRWLLQNYAKPGQLILDTHVGSASSLIAFEEMGFNYVGYELDAEYFAAANKRLEQYRSQLKIFAA